MIIGLSGYARSGKDEVASALVELGFVRFAFADALKKIAFDANPLACNEHSGGYSRLATLVQNSNWDGAKLQADVREYLQRLGVACREHLGEDVWIRPLYDLMGDIGARADVVVSDMRFMNEANTVRALGGEAWRIARPGVGAVNEHTSETALDEYEFDRYVINDGSVEDLRKKVVRLADAAKIGSGEKQPRGIRESLPADHPSILYRSAIAPPLRNTP